ncbi:MAG TPA: DnaA regulatory inactivator Hda [Burkholderiales bacterium]|nr:DnaA regulatory inactivator Hda [Burkholderiales bacterium]
MRQLALDFSRPPEPRLENFVPGRNGELLHYLARLARGEPCERFVYLWGHPGSGRSHLLRGAVAEFQRAGAAATYFPCAFGARFGEGLEQLDCVALDDVDRLDIEGQVAAFHLLNALRERGGVLLASGSAPPVQLAMREDLVTRLAWGLVFQVHALSDGEKARALAEHAARRGFRLLPEVCDYLLAHEKRDLPSLISVLDALDRYSLETRRPVTVPLVRELLQKYSASRQRQGEASGNLSAELSQRQPRAQAGGAIHED